MGGQSIDDLPDDVELLKRRLLTVERKVKDLEFRNAYLEVRLAELLERRTSKSLAQVADGQLLLSFAHEFAAEAREQLDVELASDNQEAPPTSKPRGRSKRNGGRRPLPNDLLRVRSEFTLDDDERICSCDKPMPEIGEVLSEELVRLEFLFVHQHARKKYACNRCEDGVMLAAGPQRVLPKSMAGPSLLSWLITAKFGDHLPHYRLEGILAREGAPVSRATLCNWIHGCGELLQPISDEIRDQILASGYVQTDDTSKRIQRSSEGGPRFGHMWVYTRPDGKTWYDFTETRERHGPLNILGEFDGYVQADAYSGYDELFRDCKAKEVGCWAHAKRKFDDAKDTDPVRATKALAVIKKLYAIEREAKSRELSAAKLNALRKERAPPLLEPFRTWLRAELNLVLPKSPIAIAMGYVLNQWDALERYLDDGRLEIDNNRAERALRPVAIGRKNDLFVFNERTGKSATVLMSLVESCKAIGMDPAPYLNDVLQRMRETPQPDVASLTPWEWKKRGDQDESKRRAREQAIAEVAAAIAARR